MDQIFDRLGNLLKSLFQDDEDPAEAWEWRGKSSDPDLESAWDELNDYLKTGKETSGTGSSSRGTSGAGTGYRTGTRSSTSSIPEEVKRDYANLDVPVGSDMNTVRKSYHRLMRQYHPDRFANDPSKLRNATEISQRINQSYQRIKRYRETGKL